MGYELRALVGKRSLLEQHATRYQHTVMAKLRQGIALIPLSEDLPDEIQCLVDEPQPFEELWFLGSRVAKWAEEISKEGPIAYVEAEYHGGVGSQAAVVWDHEVVVLGPLKTEIVPLDKTLSALRGMPINRVLRQLGVVAEDTSDEFESAGLRQHRDMEDWAEPE